MQHRPPATPPSLYAWCALGVVAPALGLAALLVAGQAWVRAFHGGRPLLALFAMVWMVTSHVLVPWFAQAAALATVLAADQGRDTRVAAIARGFVARRADLGGAFLLAIAERMVLVQATFPEVGRIQRAYVLPLVIDGASRLEAEARAKRLPLPADTGPFLETPDGWSTFVPLTGVAVFVLPALAALGPAVPAAVASVVAVLWTGGAVALAGRTRRLAAAWREVATSASAPPPTPTR